MQRQPLCQHFFTMACNNAWSNQRLLAACARLDAAEFAAARSGFFPSIKATLNHILTVDWFYVDALERAARGAPPHPEIGQFFRPEQPFAGSDALRAAQAAVDQRLVAYCAALHDDGELARGVTILRPRLHQQESRGRLLIHLFTHQIHHRGQAHAMLSGTSVAPPQLDEFFSAMDAPLRAEELASLGLREETIWPPD